MCIYKCLCNGRTCIFFFVFVLFPQVYPVIKWFPENSVAEHCRFAIFSRNVFQQSLSEGELNNMMAPYQSNQIVPGPALSLGEPTILVPLSVPNCILHPTLFNAQKPNPEEKGIIGVASPQVEPFFAGLQWYAIMGAPQSSMYVPGVTTVYATQQQAQTAANAQVTRDVVNAGAAVASATGSLLSNAFSAVTRPRPQATHTTTVIDNRRR